MPTRRETLAGGLAAGLVTPACAGVVDRTAQLVVGFAAGGGTDVSARLFAQRIGSPYAPAVIVENKVGVAGRLSVEHVKNAAPDGGTILFTTDFPITLYPHIYKNLAYDPLRDLSAVAALTKSALVLSVGPAVPKEVVDVKGFLAWCAANPTKANYATTGAGGTPHFVGVMLSKESHTPILPVHYRGGAPALQDLLGGHVSASVNPGSEVTPMAQSGQIRLLGVATSQRSRFLPDVPTLREAGFDIAFDTWSGVFLPAKTPANIVAALAGALEEAANAPDLVEAQSRLGNEMFFQPPAKFAMTVKTSLEKWGPVVATSGFTPED